MTTAVRATWTPRMEVIASRYLSALVSNQVSITRGMLGLKAAVETCFIPAFRENTPVGKMGDAGKLARSTQITAFTLNGLQSSISVGQTAENKSGIPYWTFVEQGRGRIVAPQGHALFWDTLGHPVTSVGPARAQKYVTRATEMGVVALRPCLQAVVENILGRMVTEWKRGL